MQRLRVLMPVAGDPQWSAGDVVAVDDDTYEAWCDGVRTAPVLDEDADPDKVLELVDNHGGRAAYALSVERTRKGGPRKALVEALEEVCADAAARAAAEAEAEASDDLAAQVPDNVEDVQAWVGDDQERAVVALEVENARAKGPRKTLAPWLEKLATAPADG